MINLTQTVQVALHKLNSHGLDFDLRLKEEEDARNNRKKHSGQPLNLNLFILQEQMFSKQTQTSQSRLM